jgi:hypothetical protein
MANLQDLINLAKADGGKFFVMDEEGEIKLVLMRMEEYQKLLLHNLHDKILDEEKVNKEITKAQLEEPEIEKPIVVSKPEIRSAAPPRVDLRAEVIDPSFDFEAPKVDLDEI